ncbi:MAG: hypothetical protein ACT4NY_07440 [Pseudonocardiales bacterium]
MGHAPDTRGIWRDQEHGQDSLASSLLGTGADAVLTPSRFVPLGDWAALHAVLRAGEETELPEVVTLIATDAAMLDSTYRQTFVELLVTNRPVAFAFAGTNPPFESPGRVAGLRYLMSKRPGCLLICTEPTVATDAYAHGASGAALGITGGVRKPRRPGDPGGGNAKGFLPGLFLRDLWEHRSPDIYADWFANSPSPTCPACNGRALDVFDNTDADKRIVLRHNVHTWLMVFDELRGRTRTEQRRWSADEWAAVKVQRALRLSPEPVPSRTASNAETAPEIEALRALARDLRNVAHQNFQVALTAARQAEETARSHREQLEQLAASMAAYDSALSQLTAPSTMND